MLAAGAVLVALAPTAFAGAMPELASYRAVYDLVMDEADEGNATASVSGRLVMEFVGAACTGYRSTMRFVTEGVDGDGVRQVTDARTETNESADGRFAFSNETFVNDDLAEESKGVAQRSPEGITVSLEKPEKRSFVIDGGVVFPTEQLKRVLKAAEDGEHFVTMDVFDGSQTGDVVLASASVIGKLMADAHDYGPEKLVGDAGFAADDHWPVTVSYFDKKTGTDDTPDYTTSFVAYTNGFGRKLRIDYGQFALIGTITHLEMLPTPKC
jgi:hypothetical protein